MERAGEESTLYGVPAELITQFKDLQRSRTQRTAHANANSPVISFVSHGYNVEVSREIELNGQKHNFPESNSKLYQLEITPNLRMLEWRIEHGLGKSIISIKKGSVVHGQGYVKTILLKAGPDYEYIYKFNFGGEFGQQDYEQALSALEKIVEAVNNQPNAPSDTTTDSGNTSSAASSP